MARLELRPYCTPMRATLAVALSGLLFLQPPRQEAAESIVLGRVFPQPGEIGLFIADADGSHERRLTPATALDYDATWSPDGRSIVFTSERDGSADLYRMSVDGNDVERLTNSPAYDDQAAFSPDGKQLVFVSTRRDGTADLFTMDIATRTVRSLTTGAGGDFRPSWSPDGRWIAFSSDRASNFPFAHGRWERLQLADIYVVRPEGAGLRRLTPHGGFCGSPKWSGDSKRIVAYCSTAEQTLDNRRPVPEHPEDSRIVSIDLAAGTMSDIPVGHGVNFNPTLLANGVVAYVRKDGPEAGIHYSDGSRGPRGDVLAAAWSPDGKRVVFHRRLAAARPTWAKTFSRDPQYALTLTGFTPSFSPTGDRIAFFVRTPNTTGAGVAVATVGRDSFHVVYRDSMSNVLAPQWSPDGAHIVFGIGAFDAFFNGFHGRFVNPGDRVEGGAQIAMIDADGGGFHVLTSGSNNNAFPSMSPDGRRMVYRTFGPEGDGLRIMDLETHHVTRIASAYDNFPLWSPRGDLILFARLDSGFYDIYTIRPDGSGLKRLTNSHGNDAHPAWSPDGEYIVFASSRKGFKDEIIYTNAPQPYGEIFVMRFDGTDVRQLTDDQWEEGTPAWQPRLRSRK